MRGSGFSSKTADSTRLLPGAGTRNKGMHVIPCADIRVIWHWHTPQGIPLALAGVTIAGLSAFLLSRSFGPQ
eukprot:519477-Pyramimonas_sp.AAC.1